VTPERYREVRRLFDEVAELSPEERERRLEEWATSDAALVASVRRLLAADESGLVDIEASIGATLRIGPGSYIGRYRLVSKLGEGGMGEVWLAEQELPLRRQVALKMIKAGMDTRRVIARFEAERQALALLEHPAIARVIDAGETPLGRPYFVMEYVAGQPINEYCDQRRLSITDRLRLFQHVCAGVQHAHNKAIIHRDLKPSNILVREEERGPWPKIIDFGIAKALASPDPGATRLTQFDQPLGTPEYMSPEQRAMGEVAVDTRADVYALGVLLHELLAGEPPRLRGAHGDTDAMLPSVTLSRSKARARIAAERGTDPKLLVGMLRGDLDWIVLKALAPDRELRYATPAQLAADLGRFLASRPVEARPPTAAYVVSRFVRRHRLSVAMGVVLVTALLVGAAGSWLGFREARQAEMVARHEAATAAEALDLLVGLFRGADPLQGGNATASAREVLLTAAKKISAADFSDPLVEARLSQALGDVLAELAAYDDALQWLERAYLIQLEQLGAEHDDTLRTEHLMAFVYWARGPVEAAESLQRHVYEIRKRQRGADDPVTIAAGRQLLSILQRLGLDSEVDVLAEELAGRALQALGPSDPITLELQMYRVRSLQREGRDSEAEDLLHQILAAQQQVLGPMSIPALATEAALARQYMRSGRLTEAERMLDGMAPAIAEQYGAQHKAVYRLHSFYGELRRHQGRLEEAAQHQRETLAGYRQLLEPGHPDVLGAERALIATLQLMGVPEEEEPLLAGRPAGDVR
jgi:eukaryotic-like serine/threonine-protein kinase